MLQLHPHGSRDVTVFGDLAIRLDADIFVATGFVGTGVSARSAPDLNADTLLLRQRPLLAKALRHVREEPGWYWLLEGCRGSRGGNRRAEEHRQPRVGD